MSGKKIPCVFYLYLHLKIFQKSQGNPINIKEARNYLFQWKIPTRLRPLIIKELELMGLVKNNKQKLHFLERPKIDLDNCNDYYELLGFY